MSAGTTKQRKRKPSVDDGDEMQQHSTKRSRRGNKITAQANQSNHVGNTQTFQFGDRHYDAVLLEEDAAFNHQDTYFTKRNVVCGGCNYGQDCRNNYGSNRWGIKKDGDMQDEEIFLCAICEKGMELKSAGSVLVGDVVPWVQWGEQPTLVQCKGIGSDNETPMNMTVPLLGGDTAFATEAVEKLGLKVYSAKKMETDKEIEGLNQWLKEKERKGNGGHGLFLNETDSRGSKNLNSGLGADKLFWDNLKRDIKTQPALKAFLEEYEEHNNVTSCWLVLYLTNGNKKTICGKHRMHPDGQYVGLARAILSFGESYEKSAQKVMRIVDRVTGRWFEMLVQHGTIVEMSRDIGGVKDKRYMHEVRNAAGTYTLCIEFSPLNN